MTDRTCAPAADSEEQRISVGMLILGRLDRIETRLDTEIGNVRSDMNTRFDGVRKDYANLRTWAFGTIVTVVVGFAAVIVTMVAKG